MNDQEILNKIEALHGRVDQVYSSVERTRKYFLWTLIVSGVLFILPLVGLLIAIPAFIQSLNTIQSI